MQNSILYSTLILLTTKKLKYNYSNNYNMQKKNNQRKFYKTNKSTNFLEQFVEWTYIKQLLTETPVDWYSINVPK